MGRLTNQQLDASNPGRATGPDFLCIGQQKAGTQWLYDMLQFQPEFWVTPVKELHYLNERFRIRTIRNQYSRLNEDFEKVNKRRETNTRRSLDQRDLQFFQHAVTYDDKHVSLDWYRGLFEPKGNLLSGDVTPAYSALDDKTIARLAQAMPDLRIILLLRDPVSRLWSHFNMRMRVQAIGSPNMYDAKEPSADSLSAFYRETSAKRIRNFLNRRNVKGKSFPTVIYQNWRRHFDASQIRVVFFDDIVKSPDIARQSVLEFFGLQDSGPSAVKVASDFNRKAQNPKRPMTDEVRAFLIDAFREEMLQCAEMFGGPAEQWPRRYGIG